MELKGSRLRVKSHLLTPLLLLDPPRHLAMIPKNQAQHMEWPSPFSKGNRNFKCLTRSKCCCSDIRRPVLVWELAPLSLNDLMMQNGMHYQHYLCFFPLQAAQTGWALDKTICIGLHAAPFTKLRRNLAQGVKIIATLRDGDAVPELAKYLKSRGFGKSQLTIMERLGSRAEKLTSGSAENIDGTFGHPVCVAICVAGDGPALNFSYWIAR